MQVFRVFPFMKCKTILKQQLNSEKWWQCWWRWHLSPHCQVYMIMRELPVWLTDDSGGGGGVFPHTAGCNHHPVAVAAGHCRKVCSQGAGCTHILSSQGWRGHVNQVKVRLYTLEKNIYKQLNKSSNRSVCVPVYRPPWDCEYPLCLCLHYKSLTSLRMYFWWSLRTFYLHACQVRVTVGNSSLFVF